jgi:excisionase family DNA binding protein
MDKERLLSIKDLAEYTGLKVSYLYKLHHQGKISGYRPFGKVLRFCKDEIDTILMSNKTFSIHETELKANTYSIQK